MEILNRTDAPVFKSIDNIHIPEPQTYILKNGLPVYYMSGGSQEVTRLELCFFAGNGHEQQRMQSHVAFNMANSGTTKRTSQQIAEELDYYGSYLELSPEKEYSYITLYSLNKHLPSVLPVLADVLQGAVYPDHELDVFKQNAIQKLNVNNQKVNNRASRRFNQVLFGAATPFGYAETAEDYSALTSQALLSFYDQYIKNGYVNIIVSGRIGKEELAVIDDFIGGMPFKTHPQPKTNDITPQPESELIHRVDMPGTVQCAIRVGKHMVNKTHPDYQGLKILNTLLGGYFGSRLMSNLREDKGYTYGIGSWIVSRPSNGYFGLSAEVGAEVYKDALVEIYKEIDMLTHVLVDDEELELVANYKMGNLLKGFDGPFACADKFRSLINYGLTTEYYHTYIKKIKTIKPAELKSLAEQYLQAGTFYEVVAGKV